MMRKKLISVILSMSMMAVIMSGCGAKNDAAMVEPETATESTESAAEEESVEPEEKTYPDGKVTVLYTNDVHTYIYNQGKDDDGNKYDKLNYASVAALKKDLESQGENVILVDAGDHVQGTAYGAFDEGNTIINLMDAAGYQVATLGNHEFDYGQFRAFGIMDQASFPYISCNFVNSADNSLVLPAYEIIESDGLKIAFVGVSTPETISKSTPVYFQNEEGEFIYNFLAGKDGQDLYNAVQKAIDEVKPQADYVIGLGHLGVDPSSRPYTSEEVIANTEGFDAFIDGHSHTTMEKNLVTDKSGNDVLLTQTGSYLNAIGKMTIENGTIDTSLISEYDQYDEDVLGMTIAWVDEVDKYLGEKVANLDSPLYVNDPETGDRLIRKQETNLGDFVTDAYYYYFNEVAELDCDITLANGGGIRADLEEGDFSYMSAKTVCPFGNVACIVEATGQEIKDVLEMASRGVGVIDPESGKPAEMGGFMHVAGVRYSVNSSIESTVALDENNVWQSGPSGEYKVYDIEVYNRETGKYDPIDLDKTYRLGGINYFLRNGGDGLAMLDDDVVVQDYVLEDYLVISEYAKAFAAGDDGEPHINTKNSPLSSYDGYLLDYENPYGSGRIEIYK